jgi:hypothetical protein
MQIVNAFTCTGAYAVLIMSGLKRVENRSCRDLLRPLRGSRLPAFGQPGAYGASASPVPARGRCAMSVSKKLCRAQYDGIKAWLRRFNGDRVDAIIPTWEEAGRWPGHIIAVMDYQAIDAEPEEEPWRVQAQFWNEGYRYWWLLSNIRKLPAPFPCRGNVGMWQVPEELIPAVSMSKNGGER